MFYMDKYYLLSTLMITQSLEVDNGSFIPKDDNENILGLEVHYFHCHWSNTLG